MLSRHAVCLLSNPAPSHVWLLLSKAKGVRLSTRAPGRACRGTGPLKRARVSACQPAEAKGREMPPGTPLFVPRPALSAACVGGLALLGTLAFADHALPPALASALYAIWRTNANARIGWWLAAAVHVVEAAVAAAACTRAGCPPRAVVWWSGLTFMVGFPALTHALRLGRSSAAAAAKAD